jgi:hypothetical protein
MLRTRLFRWLWLALLVIVPALAAACVGIDEMDSDSTDDDQAADDDAANDGWQDFLAALPTEATLKLTLPGADEAQTLTLGETAEFYLETLDITSDTNEWILYFLSIIDRITDYPPTSFDGTTAIWGPVEATGLDPVDWRFIMEQRFDGGYDYHADWRAKNDTGDEDWVTIWEGSVEESGSTAQHSVGRYAIDFTAAFELDPTTDATGKLDVDYDTLTGVRRIDIGYLNFLPEDAIEPANGTYHYVEQTDGSGVFEFDIWADINWDDYHGSQYAAAEHMWFNTQWQAAGAGRCDVIVTDGDVPDIIADLVQINMSECWDSDFGRVYFYEELVYQGGGVWPVDDKIEGDENDCVFEQEQPTL